jgi:hypothetical protein
LIALTTPRAASWKGVYVGIDVACALGKRLPICVVSAGHPLMPLAIPKPEDDGTRKPHGIEVTGSNRILPYQ